MENKLVNGKYEFIGTPNSVIDPLRVINDLLSGFIVSQAIYVMARMGIPDLLSSEPRTAHQLATSLNAHHSSLLRLLRALTTINLVYEDEDGMFSLADLGEYFRTDHPLSFHAQANMIGEPARWQAWSEFFNTIMTGDSAFERVHGKPLFDYMEENQQDIPQFQASMTAQTVRVIPAICAEYDFSDVQKVVDVGGGRGTLLRGLFDCFPHLTGILYDLPPVVGEAKSVADQVLSERCTFIGGNMFQVIPPGGDIYILKRILHDWDDEDAIRILKNCRDAAGDQGRLLVMERVLKPSNQPDPAKWMDLRMLALLAGRERSEPEFHALFEASGWQLSRMISLDDSFILECKTSNG